MSMGKKVRGGLVAWLLAVPLAAQESPMALPRLDRSATAASMVEGSAILVGIDALGADPAGLLGGSREWNANYRRLPLETSLAGVAFSVPSRNNRAACAVSYSVLRSDDFEQRGPSGERQGYFNQQDQAAGIHGAFRLGSFPTVVGVSLKALKSRIGPHSGTGFAVDAGVRHRWRTIPLTLSAAVLNAGQGPRLLKERATMPTSYNASCAYTITRAMTLVGGGRLGPSGAASATVGAEARWGHIASLRGSYTSGSHAQGHTGLGQVVGGAGLQWSDVRLDYVYYPTGGEWNDAGIDPAHQATVSIAF